MFSINDVVDGVSPIQRTNGIVKYIACFAATNKGGKTCDKKTCNHSEKEYVWVLWNGLKVLMSYHQTELKCATITPDPIISVSDNISKEDKNTIIESFSELEKSFPSEPKNWDHYNGFDKRYLTRNNFDTKKVIQEKDMDEEFWRDYNYGIRVDKRSIR